MEQIFPFPIEDLEIRDAYAVLESDKTHLRINMVSSLDGSVVIDGRSKPLSSPQDRKVFHALRSLADVILVGAGTAREENYGPVNFSEEIQEQRASRGLSPVPPIAVVTHEGKFDWKSTFFQEAVARPIIITDEHGARNAFEGSEFAEIISCGNTSVDLARAVQELSSKGMNHILCEGGPSLNSDLLLAGVVDELCLTITPLITHDVSKSIFDGLDISTPARMEFTYVFQDGDDIFLRVQNS